MDDAKRADKRRIVVHHEDPDDRLQWRIGEVEVLRVVESVIEMSPRYLLPDLSRELLAGCGDWTGPFFTDHGQMLLSIHSFVVRSRELTVVVDTCISTHTDQMLPGDAHFDRRLAAAIPGGLDAVDRVVCTHLHFDHVGWNTRRINGEWVPTFPNARYLVSRAELEATAADDAMGVIEPRIAPLLAEGLLDAVEPDHRIDDQIALVPSPGHSPGHVCVLIESGGERALITGDSFHTPVQFAHPEVSATYADFDSEAATETRRRLLDELEGSDTLVLGTHFNRPCAGRVRGGDAGAWFDTGPGSGH